MLMDSILQDDVDLAITDEAIVKNMGSIQVTICRAVCGVSRPNSATDFGAEASKVCPGIGFIHPI